MLITRACFGAAVTPYRLRAALGGSALANFVFEAIGDVLVVVQNAETPWPHEWEAYMEACRQLDVRLGGNFLQASALIFTDGGAPNSQQRNQIARLLNGRTCDCGVVTDIFKVRGQLAVLSLFNPMLKVFTSKEWRKAATFAHLSEGQHLEYLDIALKLAPAVGGVQVLNSINAAMGAGR